MKEAIKRINTINLYERVLRDNNSISDKNYSEFIYEALGLDTNTINEQQKIIKKLANEICLVRKSDKKAIAIAIARYERAREKLVTYIIKNSCLTSLKDLRRPDLIDLLIKRNSVKVAHNQHFSNFNECLRILQQNPKLKKAYIRELKTVNLEFRDIARLHKALKTKDLALYKEVEQEIAEQFNKLPKAINVNNSSLDVVVEGCLRRNAYLTDSHPNFDRIKANVYHPSVFIAKVILSKAMNQFA